MDIKNKHMSVFGLRGAGKTVWLKNLLNNVKKHIVVDPMLEFKGYNRYIPTHRSYDEESVAEINMLAKTLIIPKSGSNKAKVDLFAIDECNRYAPALKTPASAIMDILDLQRHWGLSTCYIARRPTQLNANVVELSDWIIIYRLSGVNDRKYLNNLADGLGDAAVELEDYHWILVDSRRNWKHMKPVPLAKPKTTRRKTINEDDVKEDD
jgi:hypothetical protein